MPFSHFIAHDAGVYEERAAVGSRPRRSTEVRPATRLNLETGGGTAS